MAKTNERRFLLHAVTSNGITLGGTSALGVTSQFKHIVRSALDGAVGVEDIERAGLMVLATLATYDVTKINALLAAAVGESAFYGRESGAITDSKYTLGATGPPISGIVWHGFNFSASESADATATFNGQMRFGDDTIDLEDVIKTLAAQTREDPIYPARVWRPGSLKFDPDEGGATDIEPYPMLAVTMAAAVEKLDDVLEDEIGTVAVDLLGWGDLAVTAKFRDGSEQAANYDKGTAMMKEGIGTLTSTLKGRGGAADQVLTINGLKWLTSQQQHGKGYTDYTMTGAAQWKNGETAYKMNEATKLFEIAAPV